MCEFDPPATRAASMNGFTFTARAWDLSTMAVPPNPDKSPMTTARCHSWNWKMAPITMRTARAGIMMNRSARRMKKASMAPPK